jgi:HpcH/HpaI aldolase/citrate lyase family protein
MKRNFELLLFSTDPATVREAVAAGVDGLVVDWERRGKSSRQQDADTQINADTVDDLRRVRAATGAPIICRINGPCETTGEEVDAAIEAGATEILLPMARRREEVEILLGKVDGRCGLGILVETVAAVKAAQSLAELPLTRVFIGLNDLAIERRTPNIFTALADGTVDGLRRRFPMPFGFGGLTLPELGRPIPCRLLIGEMARLDCGFSFLRRSFLRDIRRRSMAREVPRIREALEEARARPPEEAGRDHQELRAAIAAWTAG